MRRWVIAVLFLVGLLVLNNDSYAGLVNVAASSNGGTISGYSGTFNGAGLSTLIDEVFLPKGTHWQTGTVWWQNDESYYIEISFKNVYKIKELVVQADDNDAYTLLYWNSKSSTWDTLWDVPNYDSWGWGMLTRPDPDDNSKHYVLSSPVITNKIRIKAASGDDMYALSEVQAYAPVPVPNTIWLLFSGLIPLGIFLRVRKA